MADPARYYIDPILNSEDQTVGVHIERSPSGEWIKWADFEDYKSARKRNSTEDAVTRLGVEVAEARSLIEDLAAEKEALVQQGIRDHGDWRSKLNFLEADYKAEVARLTAENERLRNGSFKTAVPCEIYDKAVKENIELRKKLDWLSKVDKLVIWDGNEWKIRHEQKAETQ